MFKTTRDGIYYISDKYEYSLLEGKTSNGYTSDMVFIFREPTQEDYDRNFYGEVVDWIFDGFNQLAAIEEIIKDYESKLN